MTINWNNSIQGNGHSGDYILSAVTPGNADSRWNVTLYAHDGSKVDVGTCKSFERARQLVEDYDFNRHLWS